MNHRVLQYFNRSSIIKDGVLAASLNLSTFTVMIVKRGCAVTKISMDCALHQLAKQQLHVIHKP